MRTIGRPWRAEASVRTSASARQLRRAVDPAGRVVRAVDDDRAGPWRDGRRDRAGIEVEGGRREPDPDRGGARRGDHELVEEPWRGEEDDLVADVAQGPDRDPQPAERARGQGDVLGPEVEAGPLLERGGDDAPWLVLAELVGEPVLVARDRVALERVDQSGEWHLLRVAKREVRDARIEAVALPRARLEPLEHVGDGPDHAVRPSFLDRHGRDPPGVRWMEHAMRPSTPADDTSLMLDSGRSRRPSLLDANRWHTCP